MGKLVDKFGREINYLRISVTDRCNLRCVYCMPVGGIRHKPHQEILSFEQIYKFVRIAAGLGIEKVRITGGEPLVRKDLPLLIEQLKTIGGLKEIALTTNGMNLSEYAFILRKSGLDRINVSLDSLNADKFQEITRGGSLKAVLKGIDSALEAGFPSLKINTVLLKGFNTDEILSFAGLTKARPINVRFIEYMPINQKAMVWLPIAKATDFNYLSPEGDFSYNNLFFSAQEAKVLCGGLGELKPLDSAHGATARIFRIEGFCGSIGFISPVSQPFCSSCNKLRLTSDGRIRNCLHSSRTINLKALLDRNAQEDELEQLIKEAVFLKPRAHNLAKPSELADTPLDSESDNFSMCQIGG